MRRISAQYILTQTGEPLKRGVVTADDDGTVISVTDTGGDTAESAATEFYNGIIIPGFVNCHSHIELSHMRGAIAGGNGLASFITAVREQRGAEPGEAEKAAARADAEMKSEGVVACGDISNTDASFSVKSGSPIEYVTFIEVFGIDPEKAQKRATEAAAVAASARDAGLKHHITPHSVYSVSEPLFNLLKKEIGHESVTSLHFLESPEERELVLHRSGPLAESYRPLGITPDRINTVSDHVTAALTLAGLTSSLLLIHNTFVTEEELLTLGRCDNIFFCLCPASNLTITGQLPPAGMMHRLGLGDRVTVGTDSLASSDNLSIIGALRQLAAAAPDVSLNDLVRWATLNGARALGLDARLGSIEPGKKPGLLLIEDADLQGLKLKPGSRVRRLL